MIYSTNIVYKIKFNVEDDKKWKNSITRVVKLQVMKEVVANCE